MTPEPATLTHMPDLDYAFIAEYARVDPGGKLTAIGASYTEVPVPQLPVSHLLSVAGRIRSTLESEPARLRVVLKPPGGNVSLSLESELRPGADLRPYDGDKVGIVFALTTVVPLTTPGLCEVRLFLDDQEVRLLMFEVTQQSTS
jgi:hypothetical protein